MSSENASFYDLLNSISANENFEALLTNGTSISCRHLTTSQLKELVKTVVDSPVTQTAFNRAANNAFRSSIVSPVSSYNDAELNTVDRTLFVLQTRISSLAQTSLVVEDEESIKTVDLSVVLNNIQTALKNNEEDFKTKTIKVGQVSLTFGLPLLTVDEQLNDELYKKHENFEVKSADELRQIIGDVFINEIAKTLRSITLNEQTLDLSTVTFHSRRKTIESLPASFVVQIMQYIEKYKKILDECLVVDGTPIPVDGTLFSLK